MKNIINLLVIILFSASCTAQNVGVGTTTPATKLDIAGANGWDVSSGEGDVRIGNATHRLKFGVALSGGGAGAANIMQQGLPGGFNVLSLGAQGNQLLFINGGSASVGIGTSAPATKLQVAGTTTTSNLALNGTGNGNAKDFLIKMNSTGLVGARKGYGAACINYIIAIGGAFPNTDPLAAPNYHVTIIGEIKMFAGNFAPAGWRFCNGQTLTIVDNTALFSLLGTTYGGNGTTNFMLPDFRGAVPVHTGTPAAGGNTWDLGELTN